MINIEMFKDYLEAHSMSENTIKLYGSQIRVANSYEAFETLKKFHKFINIRRKKISQKTFNTMIDAMRSLSKFAILYEVDIDKKILSEIGEIKGYSNPIPKQDRRAYSIEEVKKIMDVQTQPWRWHFLFIALNFGLRSSEIRLLEFDDLDFENKILHIRAENTKSKRNRDIPIIGKNLRILESWKWIKKDARFVMEKNRGKYISERSAGHWNKENTAVGFRISAHNCRYTFATRLYQESKDIVLVQYMLGHSSPEITRIYLKLTREDFDYQFRKINFKVF